MKKSKYHLKTKVWPFVLRKGLNKCRFEFLCFNESESKSFQY